MVAVDRVVSSFLCSRSSDRSSSTDERLLQWDDEEGAAGGCIDLCAGSQAWLTGLQTAELPQEPARSMVKDGIAVNRATATATVLVCRTSMPPSDTNLRVDPTRQNR